MAPQLSTLTRFPGVVRLTMLLLSLIGLIFIIVACTFHREEDFIYFEAGFYDFISLTTVSIIQGLPFLICQQDLD